MLLTLRFALAADASKRIADHRPFFEAFKARYFMFDASPTNATRFNVACEDVSEQLAQQR